MPISFRIFHSERGEWKIWLKAEHSENKIMASGPITSWQIDGEKVEIVRDFSFLGLQNHCRWWLQPWIKRLLILGRKVMANLDSILKSRDITFPTKVCLVKAVIFFSSSNIWMWELGGEESLALKNWCFWTVVLEKTLESPLDCKEIQLVHPKGDQSWVFIGRIDVEAEIPIFSPPDMKSWLVWKYPDAGKAWRQEEKWTTEDEIGGWH